MQTYFRKFTRETHNSEYRIKPFLNTPTANGTQKKTNERNSSSSGSNSNGNVASKDQADGNCTSSEAQAASGKNPKTYEERETVSGFEQHPEEIKFVSSVQKKSKKPKAVSTEAQMDARIAKRREKRKQKKAMLEAKLVENTSEINELRNFAKKRKIAMQIYNKVLLVFLIVKAKVRLLY